MIFTYNINLAERGCFYADVRDSSEHTVFEIRTDEDSGEIPEVELGFMRSNSDLCGLADYLQSLGIMKQSDKLISAY
jgi:hypothetical protein